MGIAAAGGRHAVSLRTGKLLDKEAAERIRREQREAAMGLAHNESESICKAASSGGNRGEESPAVMVLRRRLTMDQIQREKVLEKLGKIKALAERGVGGEKETAQKMYEELCRKYDISDAEAEAAFEKLEERWFSYSTQLEKELLLQIFYKVTGSVESYAYIGKYKRRKKAGCVCTALEAAEIELLFNFYREEMKKELEIFMLAFKQKNNLFPDKTARAYKEPQREATEEELKKYRKAYFMQLMMDKKTPPKAAIEEKR